MKRDKAKETELKQQLDATAKQFQTQFKGTTGVKSALYNQDDTDRGPKGQLLFLGLQVQDAVGEEPDEVRRPAQQDRRVQRAQGHQGRDRRRRRQGRLHRHRSDAPQKNASCLWVTQDTAGALFPNVAGYDADAPVQDHDATCERTSRRLTSHRVGEACSPGGVARSIATIRSLSTHAPSSSGARGSTSTGCGSTPSPRRPTGPRRTTDRSWSRSRPRPSSPGSNDSSSPTSGCGTAAASQHPTLPPGGRVLLHFGAVDQSCTVWVNGHEVGSHTGGYLPFTLDVTEPRRSSGQPARGARARPLGDRRSTPAASSGWTAARSGTPPSRASGRPSGSRPSLRRTSNGWC